MSTDTTTTPDTTVTTTPVEFDKGSWENFLHLSATATEKEGSLKVLAGKRLLKGAVMAVEEFVSEDSGTITSDPSGENLSARIKPTGLSASTISKIKNVALAARDREDFDFESMKDEAKISLDKMDKRVRALVKSDSQPEADAADDNAADEAIQAVVADAPKSANSVEGGIKVALAKAGDVDEFVKVLIDVLNGPTGAHNEAACRAFIRSFAAENAGRVKAAKPAPVKTVKRTAPADGATKAKPAPAKDGATKQAAPVEAAAETTVEGDEDLWDSVDTETAEPAAPVEAPVAKAKPTPAKKATPIKRA